MRSDNKGEFMSVRTSWAAAAAFAATVALAPSAQATTVASYRFGEDDPGAVIGNVANNPTQDSGPNNHDLVKVGLSPSALTYVAGSGVNGSTIALRDGVGN